MFAISSFRSIENEDDVYGSKDCIIFARNEDK